jgi:hypothetical protein
MLAATYYSAFRLNLQLLRHRPCLTMDPRPLKLVNLDWKQLEDNGQGSHTAS